MRRLKVLPLLTLLALGASAGPDAPNAQLRGSVVDENGLPVARVEIVVRTADGRVATTYTDEAGRFEFPSLSPGEHRLNLSKAGFFRLTDHAVGLKEGPNEVFFTLNHESEIHEKVEVVSSANRIDPEQTAHQEILVAHEIRDIPVPNTHDLQSSLPTLPGVLRDHAAQLHVAGARVGETQFQLDGFEVGDSATGDLSTRVNVDTVRAVAVETTGLAATQAHSGGGVLALDTTAGDDRWRFGTTNFIPALNIERGTHFGNWYPRFTFSGPLRKGRAWFSDAVSLQHTFNLISEQPPGADTKTEWAGDNLLRVQLNLTPTHILHASFLYNQSRGSHLGLGPFAPLSTTTETAARRYFVSLKEQIWAGRTLLEFGLAADTGNGEQLPEGSATYVITPSANTGNFFETLHLHAHRWQGIGNVVAPSRRWHGAHDFAVGVNVAATDFTHSALRNAIEIERADSTLAQRTTFSGPPESHVSNTQLGGYAQDSWRIVRPLLIQVGVRADWDRIFQHGVVEPRLAASVLPFRDDRAKFSIAWGLYDVPVQLSLLGLAFDQRRNDVFFDATGQNVVQGPVISQFALPAGGLKQPRFSTTSVEWSQKIGENTLAGIHLMDRDERLGLAYEAPMPALPGIFLLQNNRRDRYRAAEISLRHSFGDTAELFGSYARSRARTNEALDYSLGTLLFTPQAPGPLAWDAPDRVISWGWTPLPLWHLLFGYFFEYRSGFPFSVVNQQQQLVGAPNRLRFPDYISLNLGIEKRFRLAHYEWAARLTVVNVTGHANPDSVINNVDAPNFLTFAGGEHRAFTARLRFVGRR